MTPGEARAILEKAGAILAHNARLVGFEPETRQLLPDVRDNDAVLLATILNENRGRIETYVVKESDGTSAAWVRSSQFWNLQ